MSNKQKPVNPADKNQEHTGRITVSEEVLKLQEYLENLAPGKRVSYANIAYESGINMDTTGKQRLIRAAHRAGIEYLSIRGYGIEIVSPDTSIEAVSKRTIKIDSAVKKAEKTTEHIIQQHFDNMDECDQRKVLYLGSVFGAIRGVANSARLMNKFNEPKEIPDKFTITIPENVFYNNKS